MKMTTFFRLICLIPCLLFAIPGPAQETTDDSESNSLHGEFRGAINTEHPDWFKESFLEFEEDIADAAAEGRRLMIYFHQDGCPYCNKLVEHNFTDDVLGRKVRQNFDVVAINMWGDREVVQVGGQQFTEKTLSAALNVNFTPTLLFFDESRKMILRLDGYLPPEDFTLALDYVANRRETMGSWPDYVAEIRAASSASLPTAMNRALPPPHDLSVARSQRPLLVLFEEPECENCTLLHEKSFQDPSADSLLNAFDILQFNRWADTPVKLHDGTSTTASKWARDLGIGFSPAMVLFDVNGQIILKINAQFRTFHILGALDYASSGAYQEEPSFQRYLSARAEAIQEQGIDVDIWKY